MKIQWRLRAGEYQASSASSDYEDIFVVCEIPLDSACIDPQIAADRMGAELLDG
jgi:hypothetical protein